MSDHAAPTREVPAGPGVVPPFPAPPTEGRSVRLWAGLGIGALVALLCCGGGTVAAVGLVASSQAAIQERLDANVGDYFDAVRDERWGEAYGLLCDEAQDAESPAEFAARVAEDAPIRSYEVGSIPLTAEELMVPVEVVRADGTTATLDVRLDQDPSTGDFLVCGVEG
ncbi:hypothetical protein [Spirilliplanes yamanashiensis]|uniref:Uncharacterized protein n=1 Tax=Spirilliplanes yamanashiensis TaxID=42233 RepID=A0A8J4DMC3_9ACTN|nr:hypothetical protein [Spirilliplanes yamanashiensis]MDP9816547.1 hypothetical protein [Spirilliplanes yamanashiensis]GIJ06074.1 hypothetical protein Sya03_54260 [Spirilliplanes yamanashiensis]